MGRCFYCHRDFTGDEKHAKSTLDDRWTLVEHVIRSYTHWAHVERSFDNSVRINTRYENVGRKLLMRY